MLRSNAMSVVITMLCLLIGTELALAQEPEAKKPSFGQEFSRLKAGWVLTRGQWERLYAAERASLKKGVNADDAMSHWMRKNPVDFEFYSKSLQELYELKPSKDEIVESMKWLFAETTKVAYCDWAIDYLLDPSAKDRPYGLASSFLENDLRKSAGKKLRALIDRFEVDDSIRQVYEWSLMRHLEQRLSARLDLRGLAPFFVRFTEDRHGKSLCRKLVKSPAKADELELKKLGDFVIARSHRTKMSYTMFGKNVVKRSELHREAREQVALGKVMPTLSGHTLTGTEMEFAPRRGEVTVVVFWGSWNAKGRSALAFVRALLARHKGRRLRVQLVATMDDRERALKTLKDFRVSLPCLDDKRARKAQVWWAYDLPEIYVADTNRKLRLTGAIKTASARKLIGQLLDEAEK